MGLAHQFILNRRRLENGVVLREAGSLQVRQKKGQAVGPFRVALGHRMINAVRVTVYQQNWCSSVGGKMKEQSKLVILCLPSN